MRTIRKAGVYLFLALFSVIALFPLFDMIIMATYPSEELFGTLKLLPGDHFFVNCQTVMQNQFWKYLLNSLIISTTAAAGGAFISTMAGYAFAKFQFAGKKFLMAIVMSMLLIPMQISLVGYIMEMRWVGLSNTYLPLILKYLPNTFGVFWMTQSLKDSVPNELLLAARVDGGTEVKIFFKIVIPLIKPALITIFLLTFLNSWNGYLLPLVTMTKQELFPVTLAISMFRGEYLVDYAAKITATMMGVIPILIGYSLLSKYFVSGITSGSVKE
jgi:cellobiose transport system permease protein